MYLQKYLRTIENIDPGKIYVENVRSMYNIPRFAARLLCEMAVVDNIFIKKIGVICGNEECNRVIDQFNSNEEIPKIISCDICESEDREHSSFNTADLRRIEFYQLKK